ncbi:hypothetical protein ABZS86_06045 [Streptomyces sp. NPDC005355]|uniref:hypothetical protein n=1 Tax=Streptomyces sp. NPDC005355 TaxID=3157038 RepID=UPI0033A19F05
MPSFAADHHDRELADTFITLLRRSLHEGAGSYGGSCELRLTRQEADEFSGWT